jgi:hypothetical protein
VLAQVVHDAASNAFVHGISVGCLVAGVVALAGALLPLRFLPAQPPSSPDQPTLRADSSAAHAREIPAGVATAESI